LKRQKEETWGVLICETAWEEDPGWLPTAIEWEYFPYNRREKGRFYNTVNNTFVAEETVMALYLKPIGSQKEAEFIAQNGPLFFDPDLDVMEFEPFVF